MKRSSGQILVTGATGFLGERLVRRLLEKNATVIAAGRNAGRLDALSRAGARILEKDLAHPFSPSEHDEIGPLSGIVHCAGLSSPWGPLSSFRRANSQATRNLVYLAERQTGCRLVHISSPAIYFRPRDQFGIREDHPLPSPVNHYARTKIEAEEIVNASPAQSIILRPRGIYGPGDSALLPRLIRAAEARPLPLLRDGRAMTDLTHVDDVVSAILAALSARDVKPGSAYNISGGEALNLKGVIDTICHYAGIDIRWRPVPAWPALAAAKAFETWSALRRWDSEPLVTPYSLGLLSWSQTLDISKAERDLGWQPQISFEDGLQDTLAALFP